MDFETARTKMVDNQIRTTDVTRHDILRAFLQVPREEFVPASPFAKLLQLAAVTADDVVLDVGCGSGYSSAILSHLAGSVVALEEDAELAAAAGDNLARLDYVTCVVVEGKLEEGYPSEAPYDVIFFEGAVERLPDTFFEQLRDGGRLVVVEGVGNAAAAKLYFKDENGIVSDRFGFNCSVKPLPGFDKAREFAF